MEGVFVRAVFENSLNQLLLIAYLHIVYKCKLSRSVDTMQTDRQTHTCAQITNIFTCTHNLPKHRETHSTWLITYRYSSTRVQA